MTTAGTIAMLSLWENVAFDHEPGFLEAFCPGGEQLIGVSWHGGGGHVGLSATMTEWLSCFDNNKANY